MADPGDRMIRRAPMRELNVGEWVPSGCYLDRLRRETPMVLAVEPEIQRPSSVIHVRGVAGEIGARSAWTATPLEGKENRPPAPALWQARGKKSHLPVQFLRKPLRDITALVNNIQAMEKRSASLRSAARHRGALTSPLSSPSPFSRGLIEVETKVGKSIQMKKPAREDSGRTPRGIVHKGAQWSTLSSLR